MEYLDRRHIRYLEMVCSRLEKVTELAIKNKNTMRQDAARLDGSRYVGASQTRLHHVHNQNFKPAAPTSGDKIINKRRFSPLVACVSLSGWCEDGCGGIQSPTAHGGDDKCWRMGQGKFALSQHGTENLELAILAAALGRRKSREEQ